MNFGNSIEMPNEFDGLSQDADSVLTVIDLHEEREASKPFTVDKKTLKEFLDLMAMLFVESDQK